jgi:hypothetical protein
MEKLSKKDLLERFRKRLLVLHENLEKLEKLRRPPKHLPLAY